MIPTSVQISFDSRPATNAFRIRADRKTVTKGVPLAKSRERTMALIRPGSCLCQIFMPRIWRAKAVFREMRLPLMAVGSFLVVFFLHGEERRVFAVFLHQTVVGAFLGDGTLFKK